MTTRKSAARPLAALLLAAVTLLVPAGLAACQRQGGGERLIVAVTIVPEAAFAGAVCGDRAEILTLVPPGYSPENYEPTAQLMERFDRADIYFSIGVPAEEARILPAAPEDMRIVALDDKVAEVYPRRHFEDGGIDHHVWLSPKRAILMVETIAGEMSRLDPEYAEYYRDNAESYIETLRAADVKIKAALEGVENRKFVAYHPAFGYFADDYDLIMYALEEEGKEASLKHTQDMINLARVEGIKVIFYQEEIDVSRSEAYAEEIGGRAIMLSPLAADYADNLVNMAEQLAGSMK